ncbi:MAG: dihydrodipicolinate synthase family protein [Acidobacteriota bacterium]|nr:dihydrodipicolinate synthase family protein [Acidobacteriota bacterium]
MKLRGILPALVTPLHPGETLNVSSLEHLLNRVYGASVDGVYVCGNTGEGTLLPATIRKQIAEIAVKGSPAGKAVIVHVGGWSFAESRDLAMHAEKVGAAAISALPPVGASFDELLVYYRELAALTGLPLLAYYFPASSSSSLSVGQLEQICEIPGVAGLKFTDYDLFTLSVLAKSGNVMYNGRDEVLAAGLLLGASGGIGSLYNLAPGWFVEIFSAANAGRWAEARAQQDQVTAMLRVLLQFPFLPALKRVLMWQGIECGEALRPRLRLTKQQEAELLKRIEPVLPPQS